MKRKNIVGDNLKRLRQEIGLTQEELALKSGLSQGYINQLESGKRRYTQKSLELIAEALSISVLEFFREDGGYELPIVAERSGQNIVKGIKQQKKKTIDKKEFISILNDLPEHIAEHYLTLLRLEREIWKK